MITDLYNNRLTSDQNPLFIYYHIPTNKLTKIGNNIYRFLDNVTIDNIPYYQFGDIYTDKKNCKILMSKIDNINTKMADQYNKIIINDQKLLKPFLNMSLYTNIGYVLDPSPLQYLVINIDTLSKLNLEKQSILYNSKKVRYINNNKMQKKSIHHKGELTELSESLNPWFNSPKKYKNNYTKIMISCICIIIIFLIINKNKMNIM